MVTIAGLALSVVAVAAQVDADCRVVLPRKRVAGALRGLRPWRMVAAVVCPCLPLGVKMPTLGGTIYASPFVESACLSANMWEIPTMETVTKLDGRRRGIFPSPFQPGDSVVREYQDSNRVTFRLLKPAEVPVVKSLRKKGYTILKAPAVSRVAIVEALRAERDAR